MTGIYPAIFGVSIIFSSKVRPESGTPVCSSPVLRSKQLNTTGQCGPAPLISFKSFLFSFLF